MIFFDGHCQISRRDLSARRSGKEWPSNKNHLSLIGAQAGDGIRGFRLCEPLTPNRVPSRSRKTMSQPLCPHRGFAILKSGLSTLGELTRFQICRNPLCGRFSARADRAGWWWGIEDGLQATFYPVDGCLDIH